MRSSRIRLILIVAAGLLVVFQQACSTNDYARELSDATESERAFQNMETRAILRATLRTSRYRAAWVDEYARLFSLNAENTTALRDADTAEAAEYITVVASFHTQEHRWNSLNPTDGLWEVRLENDSGEFARPAHVKRLAANNPLWESLFPYHDRYSILYELRFDTLGVGGTPLMRAGEPLHLVVSGAPAQLRLTWDKL